jgi:hypothetical protein
MRQRADDSKARDRATSVIDGMGMGLDEPMRSCTHKGYTVTWHDPT